MQTLTKRNSSERMIVKRVSVPNGLEELMEGLTKEVLLKKPKDLYQFASDYFSKLVILREKTSKYKVHPVRSAQSVTKVKAPVIPPIKNTSPQKPTNHFSRHINNRTAKSDDKKSDSLTGKERTTSTDRHNGSAIKTTPRNRSVSSKRKSDNSGTSSVQSTPREKRQPSTSRNVKEINKKEEETNKTTKKKDDKKKKNKAASLAGKIDSIESSSVPENKTSKDKVTPESSINNKTENNENIIKKSEKVQEIAASPKVNDKDKVTEITEPPQNGDINLEQNHIKYNDIKEEHFESSLDQDNKKINEASDRERDKTDANSEPISHYIDPKNNKKTSPNQEVDSKVLINNKKITAIAAKAKVIKHDDGDTGQSNSDDKIKTQSAQVQDLPEMRASSVTDISEKLNVEKENEKIPEDDNNVEDVNQIGTEETEKLKADEESTDHPEQDEKDQTDPVTLSPKKEHENNNLLITNQLEKTPAGNDNINTVSDEENKTKSEDLQDNAPHSNLDSGITDNYTNAISGKEEESKDQTVLDQDRPDETKVLNQDNNTVKAVSNDQHDKTRDSDNDTNAIPRKEEESKDETLLEDHVGNTQHLKEDNNSVTAVNSDQMDKPCDSDNGIRAISEKEKESKDQILLDEHLNLDNTAKTVSSDQQDTTRDSGNDTNAISRKEEESKDQKLLNEDHLDNTEHLNQENITVNRVNSDQVAKTCDSDSSTNAVSRKEEESNDQTLLDKHLNLDNNTAHTVSTDQQDKTCDSHNNTNAISEKEEKSLNRTSLDNDQPDNIQHLNVDNDNAVSSDQKTDEYSHHVSSNVEENKSVTPCHKVDSGSINDFLSAEKMNSIEDHHSTEKSAGIDETPDKISGHDAKEHSHQEIGDSIKSSTLDVLSSRISDDQQKNYKSKGSFGALSTALAGATAVAVAAVVSTDEDKDAISDSDILANATNLSSINSKGSITESHHSSKNKVVNKTLQDDFCGVSKKPDAYNNEPTDSDIWADITNVDHLSKSIISKNIQKKARDNTQAASEVHDKADIKVLMGDLENINRTKDTAQQENETKDVKSDDIQPNASHEITKNILKSKLTAEPGLIDSQVKKFLHWFIDNERENVFQMHSIDYESPFSVESNGIITDVPGQQTTKNITDKESENVESSPTKDVNISAPKTAVTADETGSAIGQRKKRSIDEESINKETKVDEKGPLKDESDDKQASAETTEKDKALDLNAKNEPNPTDAASTNDDHSAHIESAVIEKSNEHAEGGDSKAIPLDAEPKTDPPMTKEPECENNKSSIDDESRDSKNEDEKDVSVGDQLQKDIKDQHQTNDLASHKAISDNDTIELREISNDNKDISSIDNQESAGKQEITTKYSSETNGSLKYENKQDEDMAQTKKISDHKDNTVLNVVDETPSVIEKSTEKIEQEETPEDIQSNNQLDEPNIIPVNEELNNSQQENSKVEEETMDTVKPEASLHDIEARDFPKRISAGDLNTSALTEKCDQAQDAQSANDEKLSVDEKTMNENSKDDDENLNMHESSAAKTTEAEQLHLGQNNVDDNVVVEAAGKTEPSKNDVEIQPILIHEPDTKHISDVIQNITNMTLSSNSSGLVDESIKDYLSSFINNELNDVHKDNVVDKANKEEKNVSKIARYSNRGKNDKSPTAKYPRRSSLSHITTSSDEDQSSTTNSKIKRAQSVGVLRQKQGEHRSKIPTTTKQKSKDSTSRKSAGRRPLVRQMETNSKELEEKLSSRRGSKEMDKSKKLKGKSDDSKENEGPEKGKELKNSATFVVDDNLNDASENMKPEDKEITKTSKDNDSINNVSSGGKEILQKTAEVLHHIPDQTMKHANESNNQNSSNNKDPLNVEEDIIIPPTNAQETLKINGNSKTDEAKSEHKKNEQEAGSATSKNVSSIDEDFKTTCDISIEDNKSTGNRETSSEESNTKSNHLEESHLKPEKDSETTKKLDDAKNVTHDESQKLNEETKSKPPEKGYTDSLTEDTIKAEDKEHEIKHIETNGLSHNSSSNIKTEDIVKIVSSDDDISKSHDESSKLDEDSKGKSTDKSEAVPAIEDSIKTTTLNEHAGQSDDTTDQQNEETRMKPIEMSDSIDNNVSNSKTEDIDNIDKNIGQINEDLIRSESITEDTAKSIPADVHAVQSNDETLQENEENGSNVSETDTAVGDSLSKNKIESVEKTILSDEDRGEIINASVVHSDATNQSNKTTEPKSLDTTENQTTEESKDIPSSETSVSQITNDSLTLSEDNRDSLTGTSSLVSNIHTTDDTQINDKTFEQIKDSTSIDMNISKTSDDPLQMNDENKGQLENKENETDLDKDNKSTDDLVKNNDSHSQQKVYNIIEDEKLSEKDNNIINTDDSYVPKSTSLVDDIHDFPVSNTSCTHISTQKESVKEITSDSDVTDTNLSNGTADVLKDANNECASDKSTHEASDKSLTLHEVGDKDPIYNISQSKRKPENAKPDNSETMDDFLQPTEDDEDNTKLTDDSSNNTLEGTQQIKSTDDVGSTEEKAYLDSIHTNEDKKDNNILKDITEDSLQASHVEKDNNKYSKELYNKQIESKSIESNQQKQRINRNLTNIEAEEMDVPKSSIQHFKESEDDMNKIDTLLREAKQDECDKENDDHRENETTLADVESEPITNSTEHNENAPEDTRTKDTEQDTKDTKYSEDQSEQNIKRDSSIKLEDDDKNNNEVKDDIKEDDQKLDIPQDKETEEQNTTIPDSTIQTDNNDNDNKIIEDNNELLSEDKIKHQDKDENKREDKATEKTIQSETGSENKEDINNTNDQCKDKISLELRNQTSNKDIQDNIKSSETKKEEKKTEANKVPIVISQDQLDNSASQNPEDKSQMTTEDHNVESKKEDQASEEKTPYENSAVIKEDMIEKNDEASQGNQSNDTIKSELLDQKSNKEIEGDTSSIENKKEDNKNNRKINEVVNISIAASQGQSDKSISQDTDDKSQISTEDHGASGINAVEIIPKKLEDKENLIDGEISKDNDSAREKRSSGNLTTDTIENTSNIPIADVKKSEEHEPVVEEVMSKALCSKIGSLAERDSIMEPNKVLVDNNKSEESKKITPIDMMTKTVEDDADSKMDHITKDVKEKIHYKDDNQTLNEEKNNKTDHINNQLEENMESKVSTKDTCQKPIENEEPDKSELENSKLSDQKHEKMQQKEDNKGSRNLPLNKEDRIINKTISDEITNKINVQEDKGNIEANGEKSEEDSKMSDIVHTDEYTEKEHKAENTKSAIESSDSTQSKIQIKEIDESNDKTLDKTEENQDPGFMDINTQKREIEEKSNDITTNKENSNTTNINESLSQTHSEDKDIKSIDKDEELNKESTENIKDKDTSLETNLKDLSEGPKEERRSKEETAATKLQSVWRGYLVRKNIESENEKKNRTKMTAQVKVKTVIVITAIVKIQSLVRGYLERRRYQRRLQQEKPSFYRKNTVDEPQAIKKIVSQLQDSTDEPGKTDDKDDNNNNQNKEETQLEQEVRSAVNKVVRGYDTGRYMTPLEREVSTAVRHLMDSTDDGEDTLSHSLDKQLPSVPSHDIPKTISESSDTESHSDNKNKLQFIVKKDTEDKTESEDIKTTTSNIDDDDINTSVGPFPNINVKVTKKSDPEDQQCEPSKDSDHHQAGLKHQKHYESVSDLDKLNNEETVDDAAKAGRENESSSTEDKPRSGYGNDEQTVSKTKHDDDFSSVDSADSVVTVVEKKHKNDNEQGSAEKATDPLEDHVDLIDHVQNTLLDQICGKPVDTTEKYDLDHIRQELHEASSLYRDNEKSQSSHSNELLQYLNDFEPEDGKFDQKMLRSPNRDLPDIEEEGETESKESEVNVDGTPRALSGKNSASDQVELIHHQRGTGDGKASARSQMTEHSIPSLDDDKADSPVPGEQSGGALRHTSEFHDTVVVPLGLGTENKEARPERRSSSESEVEQRPESTDRGNQTAFHHVPAGAADLIGGRIRPFDVADDGVDDLAAQASLKSPILQRSDDDVRRQSSSRNAQQAMEHENNNKRNNAITNSRNMEAEAATKIQAGFRGYQVRKQLKAKKTGTDTKRSLRRKNSPDQRKDADLEEKSAVKIQAGVRGFLVRRRQRKQVNSSASA